MFDPQWKLPKSPIGVYETLEIGRDMVRQF